MLQSSAELTVFSRCCPVRTLDILDTYATESSVSKMPAHNTKDTSTEQRKSGILCLFPEMRQKDLQHCGFAL